jgi:hypothetical protein
MLLLLGYLCMNPDPQPLISVVTVTNIQVTLGDMYNTETIPGVDLPAPCGCDHTQTTNEIQ